MADLWCDRRDRLAVLLTLLPAAALVLAPWPLLGVGLWWLGNTAAHHATHRRTFRPTWLQAAYGGWLSLLLGVPQELWRQRHLQHHAGRRAPTRWNRRLRAQAALLLLAIVLAATLAPTWLLGTWSPGFAFGLLLAALHGHFEHHGGITDLRARWWNVLLQNDGFHAEHHRRPTRHWRELGRDTSTSVRTSPWPPPLRWLGCVSIANGLDAAERLLLRWPWLQACVLVAHRSALQRVLADVPTPARIVVVGGGLFPRSALLLRERFPRAAITVLDQEPRHLALARTMLPTDVACVVGTFTPGQRLDADLVVLPLALRGQKRAWRSAPPAPYVLVHDWLWCAPGRGARVAWWLGKRMHVVSSRLQSAVVDGCPDHA